MDRLISEKRDLENNYHMLKTETEKAKADLDEKTKEVMVEWRKSHPCYWSIRCSAAASGRYVDFTFDRGCFSSENSARDFLAKQKQKGQRFSNHYISYSVVLISTSELTDIPDFDQPCDLWYHELD